LALRVEELPDFPVFDKPTISNQSAFDPELAARNFAPFRKYFMNRYDSAEERFRRKNPAPFVWH
jgi:hypothetical protein